MDLLELNTWIGPLILQPIRLHYITLLQYNFYASICDFFFSVICSNTLYFMSGLGIQVGRYTSLSMFRCVDLAFVLLSLPERECWSQVVQPQLWQKCQMVKCVHARPCTLTPYHDASRVRSKTELRKILSSLSVSGFLFPPNIITSTSSDPLQFETFDHRSDKETLIAVFRKKKNIESDKGHRLSLHILLFKCRL